MSGEKKATWADVIAASEEAAAPAENQEPVTEDASEPAEAEAQPESCPPEPEIGPGDIVRHPKYGDCTVHRISEKPRFVHMAKPNERVRKLSLDIVEFAYQGVEGRQRVFIPRVKR